MYASDQGFEWNRYGDPNPTNFYVTLQPYRNSPEFVVMLPLQNQTAPDNDSMIPFDDDDTLAGIFGDNVRFFTPGPNNAGGSLTISIYSVWRRYDFNDSTSDVWEQAPAGAVTMFPSSVTIDPSTPLSPIRLNSDIVWSFVSGAETFDIEYYNVFFRVTENTQAPSLDDDAGFPQGAYSLPLLQVDYDDIDFYFGDDFADFIFYDPLPISPRKTGSYRYHVFVDASPLDIGMGATGTIVYPFQISPPGAFRILVSDRTAPDNFTEVSSFVWTGAQRVIEFVLDTQDTPSGPARVNWTFTDPIFTPPRDLVVFDLLDELIQFDIVSNDMHVSITNDGGTGRLEDGITPGQPFWMLFEWSPPTNNGFMINVQANGLQYPDGSSNGTANFSIGAQQTAFLAGPFYALEPTNLDNTVGDVLVIPINIGISNLTAAAQLAAGRNETDNGWFRVNTPVLVTVRRDRIYLINTPLTGLLREIQDDKRAGTVELDDGDKTIYELSVGGYVSEQFCVGVSLNSRFFSNSQQEIWVTPFSETLQFADSDYESPQFVNRSGLIFAAVNNPAAAAGVSRASMPPGTVVLSRANNGTGCFVIAFDRNWPFLSSPLDSGAQAIKDFVDDNENDSELTNLLGNAIGFWRVSMAIGGPNAGMVFERDNSGDSNLLRLPNYFTVRQPTINWRVIQSVDHSTDAEGADFTFVAGETGLVYITLSEPAPRGLNYAVTCTACVLEQVDVALVNGLPGFAAGSAGPQIWRISFNALPVSFELSSSKRSLDYDFFTTTMQFWSYGADAAYYLSPEPVSLELLPRVLDIDGPSYPTFIGISAGPFAASVTHGVLQGITAVPVPYGDNNALVFNPPQLEFTPDGPHVLHYTVSFNADVAPYQLGSWSWTWQLTGPDSNITQLESLDAQSLTVFTRYAPSVDDLPEEMVAGVSYGPIDVKLAVPILLGETGITVTPSGGGLTFTPSSLNFGPGQFQRTMSVRWDPTAVAPINFRHSYFWSVTGADAWKYSQIVSPFDSVELTLRKYTLKFSNELSVVPGVSYTGYVDLGMATPSNFAVTLSSEQITFTPATLQFTSTGGVTQYFTYQVNNNIPYGINSEDQELNVLVEHGGADAPYYFNLGAPSIGITRRGFVWDTNADGLENKWMGTANVFMVNRASPVYTIALVTAPLTSALTVTFESEYLQFEPASLVFGAGVLTRSFSFTPVAIPATQNGTTQNDTDIELQTSGISTVNVVLSGADAALFSTEALTAVFGKLLILPEVDVSPIAPIYTDGQSESDIVVSILDDGTLGSSLPSSVGSTNAFTVHIVPDAQVYVEPSVLEFSSATSGALRKFSITHQHPAAFAQSDGDSITSYNVRYLIKFAGNDIRTAFDITDWLPMHARQVLLKRRNIIPQFPKVLSYGWQQASFNLTRGNAAHFALIPHMPLLDGQANAVYGSDATAGGRVQFDPAVIVFAPGQMVQQFMVKAMRGIEGGADALYYRVDWEIVGHPDDTENFIEYVARRSSPTVDDRTHFPTFHVAAASLARISFSVVLALLLLVFVAI